MASDAAVSIVDVSFTLPAIAEIIDVLTLQAGFNSAVVVIGTSLLGIASGAIGSFAILRNRALMGDALAHSALPGLGIAFIIGSLSGIGGRHVWLLLLGATLSGVLGVICVQLISRYSRLNEDTAIGAVLSCFFGAGVVCMSIIQSLGTGEEGGLHHFIFGQTAAMNRADAYLTLIIALIAAFVCAALFKEFRLICFDEGFAAANGWPVSVLDLAMMSLVVIVTVIGLQAVGLLLIVALLVIPAAAARFWTEKLRWMVLGSALIGGLSGYVGSSASALLPRLPAGAVIVLVAGTIFFVSFLFAPARGVLALLLAQFKMSVRITEDHLLREIYEVFEQRESEISNSDEFLNLDDIQLSRAWSGIFGAIVRRRMISKKLINYQKENGQTGVRLLEQGVIEAKKRTRNHRLWEEYLVTHADMPITHVDYSADLVEHVLSSEIVANLERALVNRLGKLDESLPPRSIHPLGSES